MNLRKNGAEMLMMSMMSTSISMKTRRLTTLYHASLLRCGMGRTLQWFRKAVLPTLVNIASPHRKNSHIFIALIRLLEFFYENNKKGDNNRFLSKSVWLHKTSCLVSFLCVFLSTAVFWMRCHRRLLEAGLLAAGPMMWKHCNSIFWFHSAGPFRHEITSFM